MTPPKHADGKPAVLWMKSEWKLRTNPFPATAIAVLGGKDDRENGLLFRPNVLQDEFDEAVEKFVAGTAFSGLKFGYLWSLGPTGPGGMGDVRGYGKSSMLQYLVEHVNRDFGRAFMLEMGLEEADADEAPVCAVLASFDMANARSLAAVFFEATRYACRFRVHDEPTLATRLHARMTDRLGTDNPQVLEDEFQRVVDNIRGRTIGPPVSELVEKLCAGDAVELGRFVESVKTGSRGRISAANYLATFLCFAKAAGIDRVLMGCDQLEDFAATTTTRQKRALEVERFRDYVVELQPMADMLSIIVTLHTRAEQAIGELWRLADLPSFQHDREENRARVVVLQGIHRIDQARALLLPYLEFARTAPPPHGRELWPLTDEVVRMMLARSDGKPRQVLRQAAALIERGAAENWDQIDERRAGEVLDSLLAPEDEFMPRGAAAVDTEATMVM